MRAEAAELSSASFGDVMLAAIGGVYKAQADIYLGGVLDGSLAALRCAPAAAAAKGQGWCLPSARCSRLLLLLSSSN